MPPYTGEIRIFAGNFPPAGWAFCHGQLLSIGPYENLFILLGTTYGGNGEESFALPDLRGRVPLHGGDGVVLGDYGGAERILLALADIAAHNHALKSNPIDGNALAPGGGVPAGIKGGLLRYAGFPDASMHGGAIAAAGEGQDHENMMPFTTLNFIIALEGAFPDPNTALPPELRDQYVGEIRMTAFGYAPGGWASCNGQLVNTATNQDLHDLIGNTYGTGTASQFRLPNLKARVPVHFDANHAQGQAGGTASHTLTVAELPAHSHVFRADGADATSTSPSGATPARIPAAGTEQYAGTPDVDMHAGSIDIAGGGQPHSNLQPYLALHFMIALVGDDPNA